MCWTGWWRLQLLDPARHLADLVLQGFEPLVRHPQVADLDHSADADADVEPRVIPVRNSADFELRFDRIFDRYLTASPEMANIFSL